MKKPKGKIVVGPAAGLLVVAGVVGFLVFGGFQWILNHTLFTEIHRRERVLHDPRIFQVVGPDLARLAQTRQQHPDWFEKLDTFSPPWLCIAALQAHPNWVNLETTGAHLEFGGGFYHFGYDLERDMTLPSSTSETNWKLTFSSEAGANDLLQRFAIPADSALTESEFVDRVLSELDRRIAAGYDTHMSSTPDQYAATQRLVVGMRHHVLGRVVKAIHDSAQSYPRDWRDHLLAYEIDRQTDPAAAGASLTQWATSAGDFSTWLLAAYAFDAAGDHDAVAKAVVEACKYPATDADWDNGNARYRGLELCRRLYNAGKYAECAALCDRVIAYKDSGNYLLGQVAQIREACKNPQPVTRPAALPSFGEGITYRPLPAIDFDQVSRSLARERIHPTTSPMR